MRELITQGMALLTNLLGPFIYLSACVYFWSFAADTIFHDLRAVYADSRAWGIAYTILGGLLILGILRAIWIMGTGVVTRRTDSPSNNRPLEIPLRVVYGAMGFSSLYLGVDGLRTGNSFSGRSSFVLGITMLSWIVIKEMINQWLASYLGRTRSRFHQNLIIPVLLHEEAYTLMVLGPVYLSITSLIFSPTTVERVIGVLLFLISIKMISGAKDAIRKFYEELTTKDGYISITGDGTLHIDWSDGSSLVSPL